MHACTLQLPPAPEMSALSRELTAKRENSHFCYFFCFVLSFYVHMHMPLLHFCTFSSLVSSSVIRGSHWIAGCRHAGVAVGVAGARCAMHGVFPPFPYLSLVAQWISWYMQYVLIWPHRRRLEWRWGSCELRSRYRLVCNWFPASGSAELCP